MTSAAIMMNAANMAYRSAINKTRDKDHLMQNHPLWMTHFADKLLINDQSNTPVQMIETDRQIKERFLSKSEDSYERCAWYVYKWFVGQVWFECFIMCNILLIGAATGLDLENNGRSASVNSFVSIANIFTMVVFSCECVLKLVSEAYRPQNYFLDTGNGLFNTFDFVIVIAGFAFIGNTNVGAVRALRMMRLLRLLTLVKGVPQLRVIISGLVQGLKSVTYIVMLLLLVIYMFAITACIIFGANDPARFGTVSIATVTLFQISTLTSWSSVAYTSWYGCGSFQGDQYMASDEPASVLHTAFGMFEGYKCDDKNASPATTFFFYHVYIVLTAWVIMSLFIGVISMGMFEAFQTMKAVNRENRYRKRLDQNMGVEDGDEGLLIGDENDKAAQRGLAAKSSKGGKSLREKIDFILEDVHKELVVTSWKQKVFKDTSAACLVIREKAWFNNVVTVTIILVGIVIGLDTDQLLFCERLKRRVSGREESSEIIRDKSYCHETLFSDVLMIVSQTIFACECVVKILSEGYHPRRYFTNRQDGSWNCLDFFVVFTGFIEMSPLSFIFNAFPVVILRLLRLLRVFRLAKALPRLRSIVEALISGFSAVGWICILILIVNYIAACMCMLFLRENDPFHFGSVGRSMFTILRTETLDTWDQMLYVSMFGCEAYPSAYPLVDAATHSNMQCNRDRDYGLGWAAFAVFFAIVIVGAYILPTVLIGIVAISFDEASRKAEKYQLMNKDMKKVVDDVVATAVLPHFFTHDRLAAIRDVFEVMDADDELTLDLNEMSPFYHYSFVKLFGISLTKDQTEALFHLMDTDGGSELGYAEFLTFVVVVKQIENQCQTDEEFRKKSFPDSVFGLHGQDLIDKRRSSWAAAVGRMDANALEEALSTVFSYLGTGDEDGYNPEQMRKVKALFEAYDADGNAQLDVREVTTGLVSCGVLINERQSKALIAMLDQNNDGCVSFTELMNMLGIVRDKRQENSKKQKEEGALRVLDSIDPSTARRVSEMRDSIRASEGNLQGLSGTLSGISDNDRSFDEVVEMCVERLANRMVFESACLSNRPIVVPETSSESPEEVKLSAKDIEIASTLKLVLKDRVLDEFRCLRRLGGENSEGGSASEEPAGTQVTADGNTELLQGLVSQTVKITQPLQEQRHQLQEQKWQQEKQQPQENQQQPQKNEQQHQENQLHHQENQQQHQKLHLQHRHSEWHETMAKLEISPRGDALPWSAHLAKVNVGLPQDVVGAEFPGFWGTAQGGIVRPLGEESDHVMDTIVQDNVYSRDVPWAGIGGSNRYNVTAGYSFDSNRLTRPRSRQESARPVNLRRHSNTVEATPHFDTVATSKGAASSQFRARVTTANSNTAAKPINRPKQVSSTATNPLTSSQKISKTLSPDKTRSSSTQDPRTSQVSNRQISDTAARWPPLTPPRDSSGYRRSTSLPKSGLTSTPLPPSFTSTPSKQDLGEVITGPAFTRTPRQHTSRGLLDENPEETALWAKARNGIGI